MAENLGPIDASGQLVLADGPGELFPGIETIVIDGHTRAQQAIKIEGDDRALVYVADLIPTTAHVPPVWCMAYDIEPMKSIGEKEKMLAEAAENEWTLFFEHDPLIELMDVEQIDGRVRGTNPRSLAEL